MESNDLEKEKVYTMVEIGNYAQKEILSKTLIRKPTGNITLCSFAAGEELEAKISPFDNFIQVIEGAAEIIIKNQTYYLAIGQGIIIPAHARHRFIAVEQFKMIATIIKSGYES